MSLASNDRAVSWCQGPGEIREPTSNVEGNPNANDVLTVQEYAYTLEACGHVLGKRVLDVGFGSGGLARIFDVLGGQVSAIDIVATRIARLREEAPNVAWWHEDLALWKPPRHAEPFDIVVACETLQFVEFNNAVRRLLKVLAADGRLVILIPNADSPKVRQECQELGHEFMGISLESIHERLRRINPTAEFCYRGVYLQNQHDLTALRCGSWTPGAVAKGRVPTPHFNADLANRTPLSNTAAHQKASKR